MKKLIILVMIFSMLLCACAVKTGTDTDGLGYVPGQNGSNATNSSTATNSTNAHKELFKSPSIEYRWHSIDHVIADVYNKSYRSMQERANELLLAGEGGLVMNVPFRDGFVDNMDHFNNLNGVAEVMMQYGLDFWIYDEQGYPSGTGGGRATVNNPEYVAQGITLMKKTGSGLNARTFYKAENQIRLYDAYAIDEDGNVHEATITDNAVSFKGVSGKKWTLYIFAIRKFYEGTNAENNGYQGVGWLTRDYLNIMDKDAVAKFIEVAYKPYAEHFNYFDKVFAVFTDEPSLVESSSIEETQLAWAPGFEEKFQQMHGYSISNKLHYMFEGTSDEARIVRTNYRQTVGQMVAENYYGQINQFCVENGTLLSGHMLGEESLKNTYMYGDLMLCYRYMGMPAVDCLWLDKDSFFGPNSNEGVSIKTCSSIARITDKRNLTMVEICFVNPEKESIIYTAADQTTLWRALNFIYFFGGNYINSYVDIENKTPDIYERIVDYTSRLGYVSQNAEWDGEIAVYYTNSTVQSITFASGANTSQKFPNTTNRLATKLWEAQVDFLRVDDIFLSEAQVKNGTLTNGYATFKTIIIPGAEVMSLQSLKKIQQFKNAGGKVIFVDSVPSLPDDIDDISEFKTLASKFSSTSLDNAVKTIKNDCKYAFSTKKTTTSLYLTKYSLDGEEAYWIFNDYVMKRNIDFVYDGTVKGYEIYDPLTGEIEYVEGEALKLSIEKYCTKIVVVKK